ncbi:MAG: hypothetical protein LQ338_003851 [Usnochroma carphineum]|nr:MAG: hypothetical protein LQ338_003851 [Usnochroma carphineum]
MANGPNPNTNPKCGTKINIYNPSTKKTHSAKIVDTCWACKKEDIDVDENLFYAVAPHGDGRVHGIQWGGKAVGGLGMEEGAGLVEQTGGAMEEVERRLSGSVRFRTEEAFMRGCGKVVEKIRETKWRFWEL